MVGHGGGSPGVRPPMLALCSFQRCGTVVICPLAEMRRGTVVGEVLHFDYLHLGDTEGGGVISEESRLPHSFVLLENVSRFIWLEPKQSYKAAATAWMLISWSTTFAPPKICVSDTNIHFQDGPIAMLAEAMNVDRHSTVAHSACTNNRRNRTTGRSSELRKRS